MKSFPTALGVIACLCVAGEFGSGKAEAADPIVLDTLWKVGSPYCGGNWRERDPSCERDVLEHWSEITTQIEGTLECAGLTVVAEGPTVPDDGPFSEAVANAMSKAHWFLLIKFSKSKQQQEWRLIYNSMGRNDPRDVKRWHGQASPKETARTVCAIIKGQGAKMTE